MFLLRAKVERICTILILVCLIYWARRFTRTLSPDGLSSMVQQKTFIYPIDFPKRIWQTSTLDGKVKWTVASKTWTDLNPDWTYHYLDDASATSFVHNHFTQRPSIIRFWDALADPILRADLLRYLVLLAKGGVYSDIDTTALAPISSWIPPHLADQVNAVVGIEYDDKAGSWAIRPVSFCQWTLMAKPGHPLFARLVNRVISNLEFAARLERVDLSELDLDFGEVLAATGPGLMSDSVLEVVRDQMGDPTFYWTNFHGLREPKLFGDMLLLPINAFAGHQKHSHSGDLAYGEKFVQHHFGRSWYQKGNGNARKAWT